MFNLEPTAQYIQCRNKLVRYNYDMALLDKTVKLLRSGKPLPSKYNDHALSGALSNYRECHVDGQSDWLIVYRKVKINKKLILILTATGTHSDLFE